jgi:hypothetical protein
LLSFFRIKSIEARKKVITCFAKSMGLTHHAATHTMRKNFHKNEEESKHLIDMMRNKIAGKNLCGIMNMDQSLITYSYHSSKTLEMKG